MMHRPSRGYDELGTPARFDVMTSLTTRTDLKGRSLVSMREYTGDEITLLLDAADQLKQAKRQREFGDHLAKRNIACVFTKPSSRTRSAFVVAAADEGAHLETFKSEDVRLGIKESVKDLARTLGRLFDGIAYRGDDDDALRTLADHAGVPVWNALSNRYHPTQALADLMTLREIFGKLEGTAITYVGDGRNNVARSLAIAAIKTGIDLRILAPKQLQIEQAEIDELLGENRDASGTVLVTDNAEQALTGSAALYSDVWLSMSDQAGTAERIELLGDFKVTPQLMEMTGRDDTIYLHCLPALHDLETEFARSNPDIMEVDDAVFESPASRVFDQAENRMHTIKALMVLTVK
jgi:ornithine carbamoyltransferase